MKKVLVCGGRNYVNSRFLYETMDDLASQQKIALVIEGGYRGADRLARQWAISRGYHYATVPAHWDRLGPRAGPARNSAMLVLNPDIVVAFPGGDGTADMFDKAEAAGVFMIDLRRGSK